MSLDVSLIVDRPVEQTGHVRNIAVRQNGQTVMLSEEEWRVLHGDGFPPPVKLQKPEEPIESAEVYSANITHNLVHMAHEAGLYAPLWHPEGLLITKAKDLISYIECGLARLKDDPEKFRKLNPDNGWGTYESLVEFTQSYLEACKMYPDATVHTST